MSNKTTLTKVFYKYVIQNVLGMVGVSIYIIADTFFIARAGGADGLTVLNLALPIYGIIFALGSLIGIGSATRHAILKAQGSADPKREHYFSNGIFWCIIIAIPFVLAGIFCPDKVVALMGGTREIIEKGTPYNRIYLIFTPLFMMNYVFQGFVRNDKAPTIAMMGSIAGSVFNIVFDYIFMFPMNMGVAGAALATGTAPLVSMLICSVHFLDKKNTIRFVWHLPDFRMLLRSIPLGVSGMISELSSAVTTAVFNFLILGLVGNVGVAAYGVIANYALIGVAIFNGIAQGGQPLISEAYGKGKANDLKRYLRLSLITAFAVAILLNLVAFGATDFLVSLFNSEQNIKLAELAHSGMRLYFVGYFVAGLNMILVSYFSATDQPKRAFIASILRGVVAIAICAVVMAMLFAMTGVWLSFLVAEAFTLVVILLFQMARFRMAKKSI